MWCKLKTWNFLELFFSTTRANQNVLLKMFFYNLSFQNKRVTVTELRNENEQNVIPISYSQLRKSKIYLAKKLQTIAIYLFSTFYLRSEYI